MFTKELVEADYNSYVATAKLCFNKQDFVTSLECIYTASKLAYSYNFIPSFSDDDLDLLIEQISYHVIPTISFNQGNKNKIIFYDYFCWVNRGLTEQYLFALADMGFEILFVAFDGNTNILNNKILEQAQQYENIDVLIIESGIDFITKARRIIDAIVIFRPAVAFLHLAPWDIVASLVFSRFTGTLKRYFINLTDQAYWLGKNLIDVCLEFRNFGYQLSKLCRKIDEHKLAILPYYGIPHENNAESELSFFENYRDKRIAVSAGNGYKFIGDNDLFFKLILRLLKENEDLVFVLIGAGTYKQYFENEIANNYIKERFILKDDIFGIFSFFQKCDLYICSYPFAGGLTTQLAASAGLPIAGYNKSNCYFNDNDDLFPFMKIRVAPFLTNTESAFVSFCAKILNDDNFKNNYVSSYKDAVIDPENFKKRLSEILSGNFEAFNYLKKPLDGISDTSCLFMNIFQETINKGYTGYTHFFNPQISHKIIVDNAFNLKKRVIKEKKKGKKGIFIRIISKVKKVIKTNVRSN